LYKVEFYCNSSGQSELLDLLTELEQRAIKNKDARIQYKRIVLYIQLLQDHGTRLGDKITKHIVGDIWELRPGDNRVLFFVNKGDCFVLLHAFRKKTVKTPAKEIDKARKERDDWLSRR